MASYVVLARKWRPAQFSDIVGQSHVVRTLMNAIRSERIHQAYLMTGSRGIGKTSIARIFAKALRCEHSQWVQEGGQEWLRSCDQCSSCKEIASGSSVDVIEIDGASNNGVDAVREIRENVKYLPSSGARKIYIVDEVHMLTTAAFNALLKTLEEPPPHVVFVFATTEPHKIPATILSRCQRFDLRRVSMAQIQGRLAEVTASEGIEVESGALALVARAAEGSIRDSLSLLDQVIAFSGNKITLTTVRESIGLIEGQVIVGILKGIMQRDARGVLELADQAYQQGHDLKVLARSLIEFLHAAILAKVGADRPAYLELSGDEWSELASVAQLRELEEIEMIFQAMHHGLEWIAKSPQPKIVLDVLLVKCATAEALVYVDESMGGSQAGGSRNESPRALSSSASATPAAPVTQPKAQAQAQVQAQPQPVALEPAPLAPQGPVSWEGFIQHVRQKRPLLASILEHGACTELPPAKEQLVIRYSKEDAYYREQLQSRVYSEQLSGYAKEYFGKIVPLRVELHQEGAGAPQESLAAKREREAKERELAAQRAVRENPIIQEAKSLFGGELGPIHWENHAQH